MKTLPSIVLLALLCAAGTASPADEPKPYPFRSAVLKYRINGSLQEGVEIVYMDDYGRKKRTERETTLTIMGKKRKESLVEIDDGHFHYRIDLLRKKGLKSVSYSKKAAAIVEAMSPEEKKAMEDIGRIMARRAAGSDEIKKIGKGKILGKECTIQSLMGIKTWTWNRLVLKTENPALGNMVQEAVELSVDVPIPLSKFKPPDGIAITEVPGGGNAL